MSPAHISVVPSARRLMRSLRDIGYDLPAAVADIVDNSVDAGARLVEITLHPAGEGSWIRIADDGLGMRPAELDEAMRYGSQADYDDRSLGHFGLGLKTASLSQCRRLTVASRSGEHGRIGIRRWDLDRVAERDAWELENLDPADAPANLLEPLRVRRGTVVLWSGLDRLLALRRPGGPAATRALEAMGSEIATHLGMVFHRFLSGEATHGRRPLRITVNDQPVQPWDPFARGEPHTRTMPPQHLSVNGDGEPTIEISPFVLPAQQRFSSTEAHQAAAGPNRWNRQQGFYIYRRDRLVQSGGWNRLRTMDEHSKLARIAVDLPPGAEEAFGINVAKMTVSVPPQVRPALRALAAAVVAEAQRGYRQHAEPPTDPRREPGRLGNVMGLECLRISRDWRVVSRTVHRILAHDPQTRDRLLLALANARVVDGDDATESSSGDHARSGQL